MIWFSINFVLCSLGFYLLVETIDRIIYRYETYERKRDERNRKKSS
jgi:hypothetical protein